MVITSISKKLPSISQINLQPKITKTNQSFDTIELASKGPGFMIIATNKGPVRVTCMEDVLKLFGRKIIN